MCGVCVLLAAGVLAGCASVETRVPVMDPAAPDSVAGLRLNQIQVIGSHNSFKLGVQPELVELARKASRQINGVDYSHLSLTDQLNLGLRNIELDVHYDSKGGRYADPLGNRLLKLAGGEPWPYDAKGDLAKPGFKLIHDADFDFRATHVEFADALAELRAWSERHRGHVPVMVTMNCKQGRSRVPGGAEAEAFDGKAFRQLNATILAGLGSDRVLKPDDVRGARETLREAVVKDGWPMIDAVRGRFYFVLDEGGKTRETYLSEFPGLRGAAYFVDVEPTEPEASIFVMNDPVKQESEIRTRTAQGFIVRTRADADTAEARREDFSRFEAAKRSGAQVITTDYYIPDRKRSDRYFIRFEGGSFVRRRLE